MTAQPWRRFQCRICGEIYDESVGDPDEGICAGTRWEDVPDSWICPSCGASKSAYVPLVD